MGDAMSDDEDLALPLDEPPSAWAAPGGAVGFAALAAVGLAAWAVLTPDPPGRLLVGLAAFALGVATVVGTLARPRLAATPDGLTLRGLTGARHWPWARIDGVRSVRMRRLGLAGAYVEVDARDDDGTDRLLVLGRLELGADPVDVADALQHHRAEAGRRARHRTAGDSSIEQDGAHGDEHDEDPEDRSGDGEPGRGA